RGLADIDLEDISLDEVDDVLHPALSRILHGVRNAHRVDVDTNAARIPVARGVDQDPAVAGAQIIDEVLRADAGQVEHGLHDGFSAGHVRDVQEGAGLGGVGVDVFEKKIVEQLSSVDRCGRSQSGCASLPAFWSKEAHPGGWSHDGWARWLGPMAGR